MKEILERIEEAQAGTDEALKMMNVALDRAKEDVKWLQAGTAILRRTADELKAVRNAVKGMIYRATLDIT